MPSNLKKLPQDPQAAAICKKLSDAGRYMNDTYEQGYWDGLKTGFEIGAELDEASYEGLIKRLESQAQAWHDGSINIGVPSVQEGLRQGRDNALYVLGLLSEDALRRFRQWQEEQARG